MRRYLENIFTSLFPIPISNNILSEFCINVLKKHQLNITGFKGSCIYFIYFVFKYLNRWKFQLLRFNAPLLAAVIDIIHYVLICFLLSSISDSAAAQAM